MQVSISQFLNDLSNRLGVDATEEGIRELYSNVFGGRQAEGFFADKVVIVEGESEKNVLDILAPVMGVDFNKKNIGVVVAGGKGHIDRLIRLFGAFSIPCYVIIDSDTGEGSSVSARDKTAELMSLMSEETFSVNDPQTIIAQRIAVLSPDLEAVLGGDSPEYQAYYNQASEHIGPCGKPVKHRYACKRLANLLGDNAQNSNLVSLLSVIRAIDELDSHLDILEL